jgi:hypothetical protein
MSSCQKSMAPEMACRISQNWDGKRVATDAHAFYPGIRIEKHGWTWEKEGEREVRNLTTESSAPFIRQASIIAPP